VHFHTLILDGVFAADTDGTMRFDPAPPPTDREVAVLLAAIHRRVLRMLARRGVAIGAAPEESGTEPFAEDASMLAALSAAPRRATGRIAP
jgi:hypothetical protein